MVATIKREGLDEYLKANYETEGAKAIAERFTCSASFIRAKAWKMGLKTQQRKPAGIDKNGTPIGFTQRNFVRETPLGTLFKKGVITRHVMK